MPSINPIVNSGSTYSGLFYAYEGSGGFILNQGIQTSIISPVSLLNQYDVTNALQVKYDVRSFNSKLNLQKDALNVVITSNTSYNPTLNKFSMDSLSLSANEFSAAVVPSSIISVGSYSTLYTNFQSLINNYFGFPNGFTSLFSLNTGATNINGGVFDASAMDTLMNYRAQTASGDYTLAMTGTITINNINSLLRFACQNNAFNNRVSKTVADGFIENDLIYVPTGTTVTLVAKITNTDTTNNTIVPTTATLANILSTTPGAADFSNGDYSQVTTFTGNYITRVVNVPMLIVLKNIS